jgi:hypothetical protein
VPDGSVNHEFWYSVVRIWEQPVETILSGSLATLPLAPITRVSTGELPGVIRQMEERLARDANIAGTADVFADGAGLSSGIDQQTSSRSSCHERIGNLSRDPELRASGREG